MQIKHVVLLIAVMIAGTVGGIAGWSMTHYDYRRALAQTKAELGRATSEFSVASHRAVDDTTKDNEKLREQLATCEAIVGPLPHDSSTAPPDEPSITRDNQQTQTILSAIVPGLNWGLTPEEVIRLNGVLPSEPSNVFRDMRRSEGLLWGSEVFMYFNDSLWGIDGKVGYGFRDSKLERVAFYTTPPQTFSETWNAYTLLENRLSDYYCRSDCNMSLGGTVFASRGCPPPVKLSAEKDTEYMILCNERKLVQNTSWTDPRRQQFRCELQLHKEPSVTIADLELSTEYQKKCGVRVMLTDGRALDERLQAIYEASREQTLRETGQ